MCDSAGSLTKLRNRQRLSEVDRCCSCRFGNGGTQLTFRAQTLAFFFQIASPHLSLFRFSFVHFRTFLGVMAWHVYVFSK
jgi:hypothetical protein